jgi:DNA-binding transcriptional MocR family regulator
MRLAFCYPTEPEIEEGIRRLGALIADEGELYRSLTS